MPRPIMTTAILLGLAGVGQTILAADPGKPFFRLAPPPSRQSSLAPAARPARSFSPPASPESLAAIRLPAVPSSPSPALVASQGAAWQPSATAWAAMAGGTFQAPVCNRKPPGLAEGEPAGMPVAVAPARLAGASFLLPTVPPPSSCWTGEVSPTVVGSSIRATPASLAGAALASLQPRPASHRQADLTALHPMVWTFNAQPLATGLPAAVVPESVGPPLADLPGILPGLVAASRLPCPPTVSAVAPAARHSSPPLALAATTPPGAPPHGTAKSAALGSLVARPRSSESFDTLLLETAGEQVRVLLAADRSDEARRVADRLFGCLATPASRGQALALLAEVLAAQNLASPAIAAADQMLAAAGQAPDQAAETVLLTLQFLYRQGAYQETLDRAARHRPTIDQGDPSLHPQILLVEALCLMQVDGNPEAIAKLEQLLATDPASSEAPKAQFLLGWVHLFAEQTDQAKPALQKVVDNYPGTEFATKAKAILEGL